MILGVVGLAVGAIAGWIGVARGGDEASIAASMAAGFRLLPVALVPVIALLTASNVRRGVRSPYRPPARALVSLAVVGVCGGLLAAAAWFVPATNLPAVFREGIGAAGLREALYAAMSWLDAAIAVGVTLAGALAAGAWAGRAAS
jgi:hypothetical protein